MQVRIYKKEHGILIATFLVSEEHHDAAVINTRRVLTESYSAFAISSNCPEA